MLPLLALDADLCIHDLHFFLAVLVEDVWLPSFDGCPLPIAPDCHALFELTLLADWPVHRAGELKALSLRTMIVATVATVFHRPTPPREKAMPKISSTTDTHTSELLLRQHRRRHLRLLLHGVGVGKRCGDHGWNTFWRRNDPFSLVFWRQFRNWFRF